LLPSRSYYDDDDDSVSHRVMSLRVGGAKGVGVRVQPRAQGRNRSTRVVARDGGRQNFNPQNTENPVVVPDPSFDCIKAVEVQLASLQDPNNPWPNHGTQMAYNFAYDVGGLDPSMYFGFPSDLYVLTLQAVRSLFALSLSHSLTLSLSHSLTL